MTFASFRIHLFGLLALFQEEQALPLPSSLAARSLLAYLVLSRERPHPRPVLAGAFWPDSSEAHARRALTQALWQIRRVLPGVVQSDADSVSLCAGAPVWVDVAVFQDLVEPYRPARPQGIASREKDIQKLCQALELYRGDLLEGFYDDWVLVERERLREMYLQALGNLLHLEKSAGRYQEALDTALRLVQADPWQEAAHREVMRLYFALHRPEAAIKQFKTCCKLLKDELGLEPEAETAALANEIADKIPQELRPYLPHIPAPALSFGDSLSQVPLVGREAERSELIAQIEAALCGSGGLVLIEGEAGVGKTHLLQEAARDAQWRGAQVVWGHCRDMEGLPPYAPWVEALQSGLSLLRASQLAQCMDRIWLRVLGPLLPALAGHLSGLLPPPPIEPAQERERLVNAFHQLLVAWGQIVPLALVLEDLHWADGDTLDVLISIAPRLQRSNALVVCAYRGEDTRSQPKLWEKFQALDRAGPRYRLALGRLDANSTSDLIRRSLRLAEAAPLFESRLYQETSGNPLFVLETLRTLHEESVLFQDEHGRWHTSWDDTTSDYAELPLPLAVERVIARRLERLAPDEQALLNTAAVLGSSFDFELLRETGQLDPHATLPTLRALVRRHFLIETPNAYNFSHDKIRQVTYQALPVEERQHLHCQAGQALERLHPDQFSGLAHHFFHGEAREKALVYSQKAGEQAQAAFAHAEAIAHFSRALELVPETNPANRYTLLLAREKIYDLQGNREAQQQDLLALKELAETVGDDRQRAEVSLREARYAEMSNDYAACIAFAQMAVELAQVSQIIHLEAAGYLQWGTGLRRQGNYEVACAQFERGLALAQAGQLRDVEASSLRNLGVVSAYQSDYARALAYCKQSLDTWRNIGDRKGEALTLSNLGAICDYQSNYAEARNWHEQSLHICREIGDRLDEGAALNNLGIVADNQGDYGRARVCYEQCLCIYREVGYRQGEAWTLGNLACILDVQGEYDAAAAYSEQALRMVREMNDPLGEASILADMGLLWHHIGNDENAREHSRQALCIAEEISNRHIQSIALTNLGHALLQLRRPREAMDAYQRAVALRCELGVDNLAAESRAGLARVAMTEGDMIQAHAHVQDIWRYLEERGPDGTYEPLRVYLTCYQVLNACQDPRATEMLTNAYNLLQARAANIGDEQARRSFLENVAAHREIVAAYRKLQTRQHGRQVAVRLHRADAPLSHSVRDDEWVEMTWTVQAPEDDDIPAKAARRQHRLLRLAREAQAQSAAPTIDNLAAALNVSRATIKRDLAALRTAGHQIKTRGERSQV